MLSDLLFSFSYNLHDLSLYLLSQFRIVEQQLLNCITALGETCLTIAEPWRDVSHHS